MMDHFAPIRAVGCMSGTSLDGVDAALLITDGQDQIEAGPTAYRAYTGDERAVLRAALGAWPGDAGVADASAVVEAAHREVLATFDDVDLVGFHGQTFAHDPDGGRTHQAGDPSMLGGAAPVIWDFRTADMQAGGAGAPLAPFYHHALARSAAVTHPVAFLNLGGVANVSFVDPQVAQPEVPGAISAFDCGPANALIDDFTMARRGVAHDVDGALAATGEVDKSILAEAIGHPYFDQSPPKALDRDAFAHVAGLVADLSDEDGAATLTAFTVAGVQRAAQVGGLDVRHWYVCGGGRHNLAIMAGLRDALDGAVEPVDALGKDGDALEAQAFAWLAVRSLRGLPLSAPGTTGCAHAVTGGQLWEPVKKLS